MKMIFLPTADLREKSYRISLILFYVGRKNATYKWLCVFGSTWGSTMDLTHNIEIDDVTGIFIPHFNYIWYTLNIN